MIKSQGISTRISKVNEELQRLAGLIKNDQNLYKQTKQELQRYNNEQSSENSLDQFEIDELFSKSKMFAKLKIDTLSNSSQQIDSNIAGSTAKSGIRHKYQIPTQQNENPYSSINQMNNSSQGADTTVKKFHPLDNPSTFLKKNKKVKVQNNSKDGKSKSKVNSHSKIKINRSEKQLSNGYKNYESVNKNWKKPQKQLKKSALLTSHTKGNLKKIKNNQIKSTSQNRLNQSLKMHISLKKQAIMKITDLNLQKQHCHKQSEYLRCAMKVTQQKIDFLTQSIGQNDQQSCLKAFMGKAIVKFFSQFFSQKIPYEEISNAQLQFILSKKNYLNQYMIRLPDILKKDSTLCEDRCRALFEQKHFIDRKILSLRSIATDQIYLFLDTLHQYISFLLNNNLIKQTKRKSLPIQFHSDRAGASRKKLILKTVEKKQHIKQYDSQRKKDKSLGVKITGLKRTNTHKVLSPKIKTRHRK